MRAESDKRTVYKTDCSDSISLKKHIKKEKKFLRKQELQRQIWMRGICWNL